MRRRREPAGGRAPCWPLRSVSMERHWQQFFSESLRLLQRAGPRDMYRERERESLFQWNDDSVVVLNIVSSQKFNTMKCASYVKMTGSRPKWHNFVACQHLGVSLHLWHPGKEKNLNFFNSILRLRASFFIPFFPSYFFLSVYQSIYLSVVGLLLQTRRSSIRGQ